MKNLYLFTIFESDGGRPRCSGIMVGDMVQIYDLYRPGTRKLIAEIDDNKEVIKKLVLGALQKGANVVTSDFKNHIRAFDLPIDNRSYNVYDLALPDVRPADSLAKDTESLKQILEKLVKQKLKEWHKVYANAAVVYQDLENRGIWNNYALEKPIWSQKVFSGRSKTSGFSIQGFTEPHYVIQPGAGDRDVVLHFDWISADIRIAALLSGDTRLEQAFLTSDPYTFMMGEINANSTRQLTREECKIFLLQSINSMDLSSVALTTIYPQLGEWISRCQRVVSEGGALETILGRRFKLAYATSDRAVLNGVQQGSVAHAMQHTIKRVWERFGSRLLMEGHDSLVVSSPPDESEARATMQAVAQIMLYPFEGLIPSNPAFPLKVSIGNRWRKWKLRAIYRPSGVEYVRPKASVKQAKGDSEQASAERSEIGQNEGSGEKASGVFEAGN